MTAAPTTGAAPARPILIGGCSRSGTTLLGSMLGAHPACLCVPESQFKTEVLPYLSGPVSEVAAQELWDAIRASRRYRIWDLALGANALPGGGAGLSYAELLEWIVREYGRSAGKEGWRTWVDHTPDNAEFAAHLFAHFPDAKLVHLVRDGRAVTASVLPLDWGPNTTIKSVHWWIEKLAFGLAAEARWPERVTRVRYEDLLRDPEAELRRICAFAGIAYDPAVLEATGFRVPAYTAGQHQLVGSRIDSGRAEAWRQKLRPRQIEGFEAVARDVLTYLGYEPVHGLLARRLHRSENRREERAQLWQKKVTKKLRRWWRLRTIRRKDT
jgi:hypothetical protein